MTGLRILPLMLIGAGAKGDELALLIDGTLARLEREQFEAASAREALRSGNAQVTTTWNLAAVLIGSGTTAVGTGLQFGDQKQAWAGDGLIVAGATVAAGLTIAALVRKDRGRPFYAIKTNFLAPLFDRASTPDSALPDAIWRYLDTKQPGEPDSFRRQLIARFTREGRISPGKIDLLTRPISRGDVVSSDVLGVRVDMLADLRSRVAEMRISSGRSEPPGRR